jgi:cell division protein FtsI (penicillin-binding protein 3)
MRRRLVCLGAEFGLLLLCAVGKLADLQVIHPARYLSAGSEQRLVSVHLQASRGSLLDRNGHDLAVSVPQSTVSADPKAVSDPAAEAARLAPILGHGATPAALEKKLRTPGTRFVYLARLVSDPVAAQVKVLSTAGKLDGVALTPEYKRFDPAGDLARSLLGTTDIDGKGISGLENQYNAQLEGTPGLLSYEDSSLGPIAGGQRKETPSKAGTDVVLSLDRDLQYETERLLAAQVQKTGSKGGIVIISDPSTGEILSMAHMVDDPKTGKVHASSNNAAVTTVFEPGSVNKVITVSAALEQGVANPATVLPIPEHLQLGGATFGEAEQLPSQLTVAGILTVSSNIGTIQLAQRIGAANVDEYLRKFGFGAKTAIGFPNESAGLLLPLKQWSGSSIGSIPIGQGISVTALQMLEAYNVIANNGEYVAPKLVTATVDAKGVQHDTAPSARRRVISASTARSVRGMLVDVVKSGTGQAAAVPGYLVAGKTGTARKPLTPHMPGNGYMDLNGAYHYASSFVGMVPANNPRLSIMVVMDEPDPAKSIYAADTAAPLFSQLARTALRMYHIPPSTGDDPSVGLPSLDPTVLQATKAETAVGPNAAAPTTVPTSTPGANGAAAPDTSTPGSTSAPSSTSAPGTSVP